MELLYMVGIAIALVLLWRGVVWLQDYRRRLRIRLEPVPPGPGAVGESFPELGKVRVRSRHEQQPRDDGDEPALGPVIVVGAGDRDDARSPRLTPVAAASLRAARPEDRAGDAATASGPVRAALPGEEGARAAPVADVSRTTPVAPTPAPVRPDNEAAAAAAPALMAVPEPVSKGEAETPAAVAAGEEPPVLLTPVAEPLREAEQQDMFAHDTIAPPPMPGRARPRAQALYESAPVEPVRSVRSAPEAKPAVDIQDVIALHVVARQHAFNGEDLLRCILNYGLRFGDMSIFHRHERPTGQGLVLFSMAKAVEPGTFDLQAMSGEEIPGVSFFLGLPGVNSIHAYDIMVDTAKRLAIELQGEILDEQRQPLTRQLIEHYRERVQEFERRRLMQRPAQ